MWFFIKMLLFVDNCISDALELSMRNLQIIYFSFHLINNGSGLDHKREVR